MNEQQVTRDLDRLRTDVYIVGYGTVAVVASSTAIVVAVIGSVHDARFMVSVVIPAVLVLAAAFWWWRAWQLGQGDGR